MIVAKLRVHVYAEDCCEHCFSRGGKNLACAIDCECRRAKDSGAA